MNELRDTRAEVYLDAIKEVARLGIGDESDIAAACLHPADSDIDGTTAVCVEVMARALKSEAANREQKAEIERLKDSLIQAKRRTFTSWGRAHIPGRLDFIGVRTLENGQREFLTHNEGLCDPYYLTLEGGKPVAPTLPGEEK